MVSDASAPKLWCVQASFSQNSSPMRGPTSSAPSGVLPPPDESVSLRKRMALRFVASLTVAIVAGVLAVVIARAARAGSAASIESARLALARTFRVVLMLAFAATYALLRPDRRSLLAIMGFLPARGAIRSYGVGFLAGVVPVVALIWLLIA